MSTIVIWLVRFYQATIGPMLGSSCRFEPSCSNYCIEAVRAHGVWRGLGLTLRRLSRCHPFHPGGYDPVPVTLEKSKRNA